MFESSFWNKQFVLLFSYQGCNGTQKIQCFCLQSDVIETKTCSNTKSIEMQKKHSPVSKDGEFHVHIKKEVLLLIRNEYFVASNNLRLER